MLALRCLAKATTAVEVEMLTECMSLRLAKVHKVNPGPYYPSQAHMDHMTMFFIYTHKLGRKRRDSKVGEGHIRTNRMKTF